jgi:branched-subunit amino acid transport protein
VSWSLVLLLAAGAYACKAVGFFLLADRPLPAVVDRCLALIPAAVVAALVVKDTFSSGQQLVVDARVVGVGLAVLLVARRARFAVVVVVAAASTAIVRQLGWA